MSLLTRYLDPQLLQRLNHLQLSARTVVEGSTTGLHRNPLQGASIEFRQHRFYVPGDEPRHLDWRVLGRTDRPYVKQYDAETNLRCLLMLDCSGSMAYPLDHTCKFDYASSLLASLAYLMLSQSEAVGLALFAKKLDTWLAPEASTHQLSRIIDALERVAPKSQASASAAMHDAAQRLHRRSLVVLISDLLEPVSILRQGLAHLRHDRHEVIVLRILHRDEIEFPFRRWSRFRSLEDARARLCEPALLRKTYLGNFRLHLQDLQQSCRALAVEFHSFVTDKPLIDSLTTFLRHRNMALCS
jgi:uncharacterized protein (DUF58 family)